MVDFSVVGIWEVCVMFWGWIGAKWVLGVACYGV